MQINQTCKGRPAREDDKFWHVHFVDINEVGNCRRGLDPLSSHSPSRAGAQIRRLGFWWLLSSITEHCFPPQDIALHLDWSITLFITVLAVLHSYPARWHGSKKWLTQSHHVSNWKWIISAKQACFCTTRRRLASHKTSTLVWRKAAP